MGLPQGQIPSQFIGKGYGLLHEIADQMGTMRSMTKWQGRADHPDDAPRIIREAFLQLNTGRRRPVPNPMSDARHLLPPCNNSTKILLLPF